MPLDPLIHDDVETAQTASPELGLSVLSLLVLIVRRRRLMASVVFACFLIGVALCIFLPPVYTATTRFYPPQQTASSASSMLAQLGGLGALASLSGGSSALKSPAELYIGLLQTETVEDAMVSRFGLVQEYDVHRLSAARKALEKHTTIDGKEKDGIVRVSVMDRSATRAAELANGYMEQLQKMSGSLAVSEASQRRLFLEQQLLQSKDKLAVAEEALKGTEEKTGVIQVDAQARALIESAASLRAQVAAQEVQVQAMRTYAGNGNVDLLEAEQELAGLRAQLAKLAGDETGVGSGLVQEKGQLTNSGLDYVRKVREVKYQEAMFEILARQYEAAKLDEAREGALIQIVDPAKVPDYRSGPKRLLIMVGFLLLGLICGSLYVFTASAVARFMGNSKYSELLSAIFSSAHEKKT